MSYTPTEWKTGDVVTSAKLNKLEQGVADAGGYSAEVTLGDLVCAEQTVTTAEDDGVYGAELVVESGVTVSWGHSLQVTFNGTDYFVDFDAGSGFYVCGDLFKLWVNEDEQQNTTVYILTQAPETVTVAIHLADMSVTTEPGFKKAVVSATEALFVTFSQTADTTVNAGASGTVSCAVDEGLSVPEGLLSVIKISGLNGLVLSGWDWGYSYQAVRNMITLSVYNPTNSAISLSYNVSVNALIIPATGTY